MRKTRFIALILVAVMLVVTGCSSNTSGSGSQTPGASSAAPSASGGNSQTLDGSVTFGVVAPITGTNKMVGEYVKNGAEMAAKEINENGGILGKELKLVFEDEVDNLQASVNAMTKIMNYDEVVAFFGSTYSGNCIAASPVVLEKKIAMFAGVG